MSWIRFGAVPLRLGSSIHPLTSGANGLNGSLPVRAAIRPHLEHRPAPSSPGLQRRLVHVLMGREIHILLARVLARIDAFGRDRSTPESEVALRGGDWLQRAGGESGSGRHRPSTWVSSARPRLRVSRRSS